MRTGTVGGDVFEYRNGWTKLDTQVIEEALVTLSVNGVELTNIMCSPLDLKDLAIGMLKNENLIQDLLEIDHITISANECCLDVWLTHSIQIPELRIRTSGCGAGITFSDPSQEELPLEDDFQVDPKGIFPLFRALQTSSGLYARARGVHSAGIADAGGVLQIAEDVGRHNTLDKLAGACLRKGIQTRGRILITTGRISSEMLQKGTRMGTPIIASRNSPTSLSVEMAQSRNITLIGYVRRDSLKVYSHPHRLGLEPSKLAPLEVRVGQDDRG